MADLVGRTKAVEVLDVATQSEKSMTLGEWANYFEQPHEKRKKVLNVSIDLQFY